MLFRQSNNTKYISIILKLSRERVSQPDPAELKGCTMIFRQSNNPKHFLEHFKALWSTEPDMPCRPGGLHYDIRTK
jgi:hypothetical protein